VDSQSCLNDFLVYGDLQPAGGQSRVAENGDQSVLIDEDMKGQHDQLYGPLFKSFNIRSQDLVKKTIRFPYLQRTWHVVSYYRPVEVLEDCLKRPFMDQDNQDTVQMLHVDSSQLPLGCLSWSYRTGENSVPSGLCPGNTGASAWTDVRPYHPAWNVQQNSLPYPGVWDMEIMPESKMASETHQHGLNLEPLWPAMEDSESLMVP
jgi:hypothetical protein